MKIKQIFGLIVLAVALMTGSKAYAHDGDHKYVNGICTITGCTDRYQKPAQDGSGNFLLSNAGNIEWLSYAIESQEMSGDKKVAECTFLMTNDIDFTGVEHTMIGRNQTNRFNGVFDGQYHKISNCVCSSTSYCGFFGIVRGGSTIKNLTIDETCSFTASDHAGGLICMIQQRAGGTVEIANCVNKATVTSTNKAAAGILGAGHTNNDHPIVNMRNCVNMGKISSSSSSYKAAGLIGWLASNDGYSTIYNSYNLGALTLLDVEKNIFRGKYLSLDNCYELNAEVLAAGGKQGLKTDWTTADPVTSGELCYFLNNGGTTFRQTLDGTSVPLPGETGDIVYQNTNSLCDGTPIITYSNSKESGTVIHTPNGKGFCSVCGHVVQTTIDKDVDGFYIIAKAADLEVFANMVNSSTEVLNAKLTADIDFADGTDQTVHTCIGTPSNPFKGTFDGQGHKISNLLVDSPDDNAGLIGYATGGVTVKSVTLDATCSIKGKMGVGLVGTVEGYGDVHLTNLGFEGRIEHVTGGKNGGGILGGNLYGMAKIYMTGCYMTGTVVGMEEDGAICGWAGSNNPVITNCWNSGEVLNAGTGNVTTPGSYCIRDGGSGTYTNCFSTVGDQWTPNIATSAIASGELCYKLNGDQSDIIWCQTLGVDAYPTHATDSKIVYGNYSSYRCDGKGIGTCSYSNTQDVPVIPSHTPNGKGFCSVCGKLLQTTIDVDADGSYIIAKAADLEVFANMVNSSTEVLNAKLTADIDFADGTDETLHTCIGTPSNPFRGTFDGQHFKISHLVVDSPDDNAGLIGHATSGVTVKNVTLDATCSIKGKMSVGLVGTVEGYGNTYLTNLGFEGRIEHVAGGKNGGGILGGNLYGMASIYMKGCYMTGTVVGMNEEGAISGWVGANSPVVTSCWNSGEVQNADKQDVVTPNNYCLRDGNSGVYTNCFSTVGDQWTPNIDASALASGELCYKLNGDQSDIVWYQTLGVDAYPTTNPTHKKVFFDGTSYTNNEPSPFQGNAVAAGAEWYLYNLATKQWLGNNNSQPNVWTTRANVNEVGLDWMLSAMADGWKMDAKFNGNGSMNGDGNGDNGYLNSYQPATKWTFTEMSYPGATVAYKINAGTTQLGVGDEGDLDFANESRNVWVLVTKAERIAWMRANASAANPVEASFLIPNYDLAADNKRDTWSFSSNGGNAWNNVDNALGRRNRAYETWSMSNLDVHVDMTVPIGKYRVIGQAVYTPTAGVMNIDEYNTYVAQGDASVYGLVVANDQTGKMASAYSQVTAARLDGYNTRQLDATHWGCSDVNEFNHHLADRHFDSQPVEVSVSDGKLRIGYKMAAGYPSSNWVTITGARLQYMGISPDMEMPIKNAFLDAVKEADSFDTSVLTTALKDKFTAAHNEARAVLVDWSTVSLNKIAAASEALNAVLSAAKGMNTTQLKDYLAKMEAIGYTDTIAVRVLDEGLTQAELDAARDGAVIRLKQTKSTVPSAMPAYFTKVTETPVGTNDNNRFFVEDDLAKGLYIYNVGTGRWFCGGDEWGVHAAVGYPGIKVTLPAYNTGAGQYNYITTWLCNGNWGTYNKLNYYGDCDNMNGNGWKFFSVDDTKGIVTVARCGSDTGDQSGNGCGTKNLLGFSDNTLMRVDADKEDAANKNNQWIFVTEAQRDAAYYDALAGVSATNPIDLTWKIKMPGFNQRERVEGSNQDGEQLYWECNHDDYKYPDGNRHVIYGRGDKHADFCVEIFRDDWGDEFSLMQTVSGLYPGTYRVKVQGYNNGCSEKAKLVANGQSVELRDITSEPKLPWVQNGEYAANAFEAVEYFQCGLYWNEVICEVGADGKLTIGVTDDNGFDGSFLFDNFRLECIGVEKKGPAQLKIRCEGNWSGVDMAEVDDDAKAKHFQYKGWTGTNRDEGIFFNFLDGDGNYWCPTTITTDAGVKLHELAAGEEAADMENKGATEHSGYAVATSTNLTQVDVYFELDGRVRVIADNALSMLGDAIYLTGENEDSWSRESAKCVAGNRVLNKISEGVYEGVVTVNRPNELLDMTRLFTKPDNGELDNYIGFSGTLNAGDGTYTLSRRPSETFRMRKGDTKVTVDFNTGAVTFDYQGTDASYVYAVGTLVGHTWENNNHDAYKLTETEPGSLVFKGIVRVAKNSDGTDSYLTFFEQRTSTGWNEGRWLPANSATSDITPDTWRDNVTRWGDGSWKIAPGAYVVTLDAPNMRLFCETAAEVTVTDAGYATWVAPFAVDAIPEGVEVYGAEDRGTSIGLNPMDAIPADEAVVLHNEGTYVFCRTQNEVTSAVRNDLTWQADAKVATGSEYVLAKKNGMVGFYKAKAGTTIAARKAYIVNTNSEIQALFFDTTTAIESAPGAQDATDSPIYNVAGQRIDKLQRGVNIVNGKKILK